MQNILAATPNPSLDQFRSIIAGLTATIRIRDDVHREKVEGLEANIVVLQQRVDDDDNGLSKCPPGYKENREHLPNFTIPLDNGTEQFTVSSSNLMMEGLRGSTVGPKGRKRHKSLSCMLLPTTPLTNQWSRYPPGSIVTSGATKQHTPSSRMPSMTSMTGHSSPMSTDTANMTRKALTSPRSWSFWRQTDKVLSKTMLSSRSTSSQPNSQTKSSTSPFSHLWAPFSQPGRGGVCSNHHISSPTRDKDVSA